MSVCLSVCQTILSLLFSASSTISIDYYNRALSGWEPFVEPWKAKLTLNRTLKANDASPRLVCFHIYVLYQIDVCFSVSLLPRFDSKSAPSSRTNIAVQSDDILNLNASSCFVDLYQETFKRWTEDFYGLLKASDSITGSSLESEADQFSFGLRRRLPFVPFEMRNKTGVPLWFATITCAPGEWVDC